MEIFYMACAGLATLALIVAVYYLARTLDEVRLTAIQARRTAEAAQGLIQHLDENVESFSGITRKVGEFMEGVKSPWLAAFQVGLGWFKTWRQKRAQAAAEQQEAERVARE